MCIDNQACDFCNNPAVTTVDIKCGDSPADMMLVCDEHLTLCLDAVE